MALFLLSYIAQFVQFKRLLMFIKTTIKKDDVKINT